MDELKPCPFCGGEAHLLDDYVSEMEVTLWSVWHVCEGCKGFTSGGYGSALNPSFETPWYRTRDEAVCAWNRRAR